MFRRTPDAPPPLVSYSVCPAKTFSRDGKTLVGRSVLNHCQIVGEVARELISRYPASFRDILFPVGSPMVAAAHDVGKVSPCFFEKIRQACTETTLIPLPNINPALERQWNGHAGVSQLAAKKIKAPKYVPEILGQHHGFAPKIGGLRADDDNFGGPAWQLEREALVEELKLRLVLDFPQVDTVAQARLLAGLTSVADWIGSGKYFEDPALAWEHNISNALDAAGFIPPGYRKELNFENVFGFRANEIQNALIAQVDRPGVYVLEAPMGCGKTEAALFAAYRILDAGGATGIYFALPTQLTSNKMIDRFNRFLDAVLATDCRHRALLLHANAWLLDTDMGEEGRPGGAWFNQSKRGTLAPFAVGTVDQALMAVMNVKHGFVRAFGLAGKVVILDEVHTYDTYTGTILDALVGLLRSLGCTVIILSATLTRDRRAELVGSSLGSDAYPLVTAVSEGLPATETFVADTGLRHITLRMSVHPPDAIEEALKRACLGQHVLWIENTVKDAQERYMDLAARAVEAGVECGLLHSRYTPIDRLALEDHWVELFGKNGWIQRPNCGRILVGTQVLEQSLDIDADFLVSRFAPSDMILQRLGRLWRHTKTPRVPSARPEVWLIAPKLCDAILDPRKAFGPTALVYSPYVLCRSLEVWEQLNTVTLPQDIRSLIERTYLARDDDGEMRRWQLELEDGTRWRIGRRALRQLARLTLSDVGNTLPESRAQTRYSEAESVDVLLLRNIEPSTDRKATFVRLITGEQCVIPWRKGEISTGEWRRLTAALMRQVVPVRPQEAPKPTWVSTLKNYGFHHCFYLGHPDWPEDESMLRIGVVTKSGSIEGLHGAKAHDKRRLSYRSDWGYRTIAE